MTSEIQRRLGRVLDVRDLIGVTIAHVRLVHQGFGETFLGRRDVGVVKRDHHR